MARIVSGTTQYIIAPTRHAKREPDKNRPPPRINAATLRPPKTATRTAIGSAFERLRADILRGVLAPGKKLRIQDISRRIHVADRNNEHAEMLKAALKRDADAAIKALTQRMQKISNIVLKAGAAMPVVKVAAPRKPKPV